MALSLQFISLGTPPGALKCPQGSPVHSKVPPVLLRGRPWSSARVLHPARLWGPVFCGEAGEALVWRCVVCWAWMLGHPKAGTVVEPGEVGDGEVGAGRSSEQGPQEGAGRPLRGRQDRSVSGGRTQSPVFSWGPATYPTILITGPSWHCGQSDMGKPPTSLCLSFLTQYPPSWAESR